MNNWPNEFMAEYHRQRILEQVEQIRLERLALQSRSYRPRVLRRAMINIGNRMISAGEKLCKHYEVSYTNCTDSPASAPLLDSRLTR